MPTLTTTTPPMPTDPKPQFVGTAGPGANLDINVPLPGLFVGRRLVLLDGIAKAKWNPAAYTFGTPPAEAVGVVKKGGVYVLDKPDRFTQLFVDRKPVATSIAAGALQVNPAVTTRAVTTPRARVGASTTKARAAAAAQPIAVAPGTTPPASAEATALQGELDASLTQLSDGIIRLPTTTWSGAETTVAVDVSQEPAPALFIIQSVGISSFLGDYGLGKTVKTFSLLPGEETKIHTRTWKATQESQAAGSSIIDSYNSTTADEFASTLYDESTDKVTQDKSSAYSLETGGGLNIGIVKAEASGSAEATFASGTEEFAKTTSEAISKHAATASSNREASVTSSSESSVSTEDEEVTERTIRNINVKRVLNFVFRELNQKYIVKTHLKDVRIGFSNGNIDSWMEVPVSGLRSLLTQVLANDAAVTEVGQTILRMIGMVWDANDVPVPTIERVQLSPDGSKITIDAATRDAKGNYPMPPADGVWNYRYKRGPLAQGGSEFVVDGVLLKENTVVLKTDSLVVESLLGTADSLDDYSVQLQTETIREKKLANDAVEAETAKTQLGVALVRGRDAASVELYAKAFGPAPADDGA